MADSNEDTYDSFRSDVDMTAGELEKWLKSDEAKSVGVDSHGDKKTDSSGGKSVGYESGEHIIQILRPNKADLTDDDYAHMKKVSGYIHRHLAQKPGKEDIEDSRWRYSLMNWGHDPLN